MLEESTDTMSFAISKNYANALIDYKEAAKTLANFREENQSGILSGFKARSLQNKRDEIGDTMRDAFYSLQIHLAESTRNLPLGIQVTGSVDEKGNKTFRYGAVIEIDGNRVPVILRSGALQIEQHSVVEPYVELRSQLHPRLHLPFGHRIPLSTHMPQNFWISDLYAEWQPEGDNLSGYSYLLPPQDLIWTNKPQLVTPTPGFRLRTIENANVEPDLLTYQDLVILLSEVPTSVIYKRS